MDSRVYTAIIHREEELYVAECPEVGTVSQGTTTDEANENLKEASELFLAEFAMQSTAKWECAHPDGLMRKPPHILNWTRAKRELI